MARSPARGHHPPDHFLEPACAATGAEVVKEEVGFLGGKVQWAALAAPYLASPRLDRSAHRDKRPQIGAFHGDHVFLR
jgi:hypothetical protein